jgi:TPR repeat protein
MKKVNFNLLVAIFTVVIVFSIPYVLSAQAGKKGDFNKAKRYHDSAAVRMQKNGENDAEVLKLYNQAIEEYKKCITVDNKNTGEAYQYLGRILFTGPRSLRDYVDAALYLHEALEIYEKEKKQGIFIPLCYNEIGTAMYRLGDYYAAFDYWSKSSELSYQFAGDEAQVYWLGLGVEQNFSKAMEMYRKGALAGRDLWMNIYSLDYQINEYKKGNFDNDGMYLFLDYIHSKSMGEPKDEWMSILKQSADLGWPPAQVDYWIFCRDDKEYSKGMPYLQKAVDANFVPAYFHMGYVYHAGLGVKVNYQEAAKYYERAAVEGYPLAQSNLGVLYYDNLISAEKGFSNRDLAAYWWNISADQGLSNAIQNKELLSNYRAPMSNLETAIMVFKSVSSIIKTSTNIYNSVSKSKVRGYVPPSNNTQQTAQSSSTSQSNTSSSSSSSSRSSSSSSSSSVSSRDSKPSESPCMYCSNGKCRNCSGAGSVKCGLCRGSGQSNAINKTGKMKCYECDGKGTRKCGVCYGSGKCGYCKGTGKR